MSEKKIGIITVVAKTFGLKLKDDNSWYNPTGDAKKFVKENKDILKGKQVEIDLYDYEGRTYVKDIKILESSKPEVKQERVSDGSKFVGNSKDGYWTAKAKTDLVRDSRIARYGSLNLALEIIKIARENGDLSVKKDTAGVLYLAKSLAKDILEWVKEE